MVEDTGSGRCMCYLGQIFSGNATIGIFQVAFDVGYR